MSSRYVVEVAGEAGQRVVDWEVACALEDQGKLVRARLHREPAEAGPEPKTRRVAKGKTPR